MHLIMLALTALLLRPGHAFAQGLSCGMSVTPLTFGTIDMQRNAPAETTATIEVVCTAISNQPVPVSFSIAWAGAGLNGELDASGAPLRFRLFLDRGMMLPFGDGGGAGERLSGTGVASKALPFRKRFTVYGRASVARQLVRAGVHEAQGRLVLEF